MELLRGLDRLRPHHRPCVATIGAFDGVHLGHQAVMEQLRRRGEALDLPTAVVCFEPLPREYLAPDQAPARLQSFREKCEVLASQGVDRLLCLRFDESLRQMGADAFARGIFVDGLGVRCLILGDDFRFGKQREGDADFMRRLGREEGFEVLSTATCEIDGERVSSTRIRGALAEGDFPLVERLLGRPYDISGKVIYGRQLGRQIGVPTANIALRRRSLPVSGVFAVAVTGGGLTEAPAIANVGSRPTVDAGMKPNLEVHVLEGDHQLYGQRLDVSFLKKIRDEKRFESVDMLKDQIFQDIDYAREWFTAGGEVAQHP